MTPAEVRRARSSQRVSHTPTVTLVGGSVASGKTTWVQAQKTPGDLIVDTDMLWFALMGGEHYPQPVELLPHVMAARNAVIDSLARGGSLVRAWVISGEQSRPVLDDLARKLGAGLVIINTPRYECLRRIGDRNYPVRGKRTWAKLADEWHDNFEVYDTDNLVSWPGDEDYRPLGGGRPLAHLRFNTDRPEIRRARSTKRYQNARREFLLAHPLCKACEREGRTMAAVELDHVVPADKAPELFWDTTNWQGLCRPCHEAKTADENRRETPERAAWRERLEGIA